ncbi:MAG TPA: hypothetical protein VJP88_04565 [Caulobacteraceae bacterium]|nr:hypothetical protein [Caulobacteraceae bacterium]
MATTPTTTLDTITVTAAKPLPAPPARQVKAYRPQISVVLKKAINRRSVATGVDASQRVQGNDNASIDLARFLGKGFGVSVCRTVRGPSSGNFTIRFPDKMVPGQLESIYGLIEPMDVIEIRMQRTPSGPGTASMPIVIRGLVTDVGRDQVMTEAGPQRAVVVTGHDYSKILQLMRVIYLPTMIVGQDLLTALNLFTNYNIDAQNYVTADAFVNEVMVKAVQPFIKRLQAATGGGHSPIEMLNVEALSPAASSNVSPYGTQGWGGGAIFDLLTEFGDVGPWQELFVEDRDDGPYLVYRPAPLRTATGGWVQAEVANLKTAVAEVLVESADIIELHARRSDANVANYFWVDAPAYQIIGSPTLQQDQNLQPAPAVTGYQNCDPAIYGTRLMRVSTNQGGRYDGQAQAALSKGDEDALNLNNAKRQIIIDANQDNVVFEAGSMRLKGNEAIRAGGDVKVRSGNFVWRCYGHTVQHDYIVGGAFTTTVTFERGTGFIEREQLQGASSAYLQEIGRGVPK